MRAFVTGLLLLFASTIACAGKGDIAEVRQQIQASLRVTGHIEVDATGAVTAHAIDGADKLDAGVAAMLDATLAHWRFQPVLANGQPQAVKADMSLLLVADKIGGGQLRVRIKSARFDDAGLPPTARASIARRGQLTYPPEALRAGVTGTVYVVLRIDRAGNVVDAAARQVNLRYLDNERAMAKWRDVLAEPTVARVRRWKFHAPTTGPDAGKDYFTGTLPVVYSLSSEPRLRYGQWDSYVPGPRAEVAWLDAGEDRGSAGAEALGDGQFVILDQALTLLTPLDEG